MAQNFDLHLDPNTLLWTAVTQITAAMLQAWQRSEMIIILLEFRLRERYTQHFQKYLQKNDYQEKWGISSPLFQ